MLADALAHAVPELCKGAIAIVDSPRSPLDLDCSSTPFSVQLIPYKPRKIDTALRRMILVLNENPERRAKLRLSLFPSPMAKYFLDCVFHPDCKPHLSAFGRTIFSDIAHKPISNPGKLSGGALFTRFMIAGFATYHALARLGLAPFEGYPYLAFRLWMNEAEQLPAKKYKSEALERRRQILNRLATDESIEMTAPLTLDQADAAILAITPSLSSSPATATWQIVAPAEGRFLVALEQLDSTWFEQLSLGENRLA